MPDPNQRIPAEDDPRLETEAPETEVLLAGDTERLQAEPAEAEPAAETEPSLDELQAEADAAQKRLSEARLRAAGEAAPNLAEEPRERQAVAHAEHDSRVDELSEERATHPEPFAPWIRPSSLEAPEPREGFVQRWVRISTRGADDPRNVNKSMREGWSPRPMDSMPADFVMSSGSPGQERAGHFIVDDLMLCEMPASVYAQRRAYYEAQTAEQMEAVEADLDSVETQTGGPHIQKTRKSSVTHPSRVVGRRVEVADDV